MTGLLRLKRYLKSRYLNPLIKIASPYQSPPRHDDLITTQAYLSTPHADNLADENRCMLFIHMKHHSLTASAHCQEETG